MHYQVKPEICATETPPISESLTWLPTEEDGRPAIILSQAVPNYPPAPALQDHLARLSHAADTSFYTDVLGTPELRSALAQHLAADYQGSVAADQLAISVRQNA